MSVVLTARAPGASVLEIRSDGLTEGREHRKLL